MENTAHQMPDIVTASLRENVEPLSFVTGINATQSKAIPAPYPSAMPRLEILDVDLERASLYASMAPCNIGSLTVAESAVSKLFSTAGPDSRILSTMAAFSRTSREDLARPGR